MFHSEGMEHRLNRIHEKALRRIYSSDSPLNVTELLTQDKSFTIHKKNCKVFASGVVQVSLLLTLKHISHLVLVFLL